MNHLCADCSKTAGCGLVRNIVCQSLELEFSVHKCGSYKKRTVHPKGLKEISVAMDAFVRDDCGKCDECLLGTELCSRISTLHYDIKDVLANG